MTRTLLTPVSLPGGYALVPATLPFVSGDVANGNAFAHTGQEILIAQNTDVAAKTITVTSKADPTYGRTGHISAYSIPAGEFRVFQKFPIKGWRQTDNRIYVDVSHANVKLAVIKES